MLVLCLLQTGTVHQSYERILGSKFDKPEMSGIVWVGKQEPPGNFARTGAVSSDRSLMGHASCFQGCLQTLEEPHAEDGDLFTVVSGNEIELRGGVTRKI